MQILLAQYLAKTKKLNINTISSFYNIFNLKLLSKFKTFLEKKKLTFHKITNKILINKAKTLLKFFSKFVKNNGYKFFIIASKKPLNINN